MRTELATPAPPNGGLFLAEGHPAPPAERPLISPELTALYESTELFYVANSELMSEQVAAIGQFGVNDQDPAHILPLDSPLKTANHTVVLDMRQYQGKGQVMWQVSRASSEGTEVTQLTRAGAFSGVRAWYGRDGRLQKTAELEIDVLIDEAKYLYAFFSSEFLHDKIGEIYAKRAQSLRDLGNFSVFATILVEYDGQKHPVKLRGKRLEEHIDKHEKNIQKLGFSGMRPRDLSTPKGPRYLQGELFTLFDYKGGFKK